MAVVILGRSECVVSVGMIVLFLLFSFLFFEVGRFLVRGKFLEGRFKRK